jgi:hypothetical protein
MPMSKKQKKEIKRKGAKHLVKAGKSIAKGFKKGLDFQKRLVKSPSCVARGMKRGLSLAAASEACGLTKTIKKPLKIKRTKGKSRMTKDVKKV